MPESGNEAYDNPRLTGSPPLIWRGWWEVKHPHRRRICIFGFARRWEFQIPYSRWGWIPAGWGVAPDDPAEATVVLDEYRCVDCGREVREDESCGSRGAGLLCEACFDYRGLRLMPQRKAPARGRWDEMSKVEQFDYTVELEAQVARLREWINVR